MLRYKFEYPRAFKKNWEHSMPYLQLVGVAVIAVKLLYPFDQEMRHPRKKTEPSVAVVNWKVWLREKKKFEQEKFKYSPLTDDEAANIREEDVAEMSDEMVDRYMDWFAERWIIRSNTQGLYERSNLRSNLNALFPLGDVEPSLAAPHEESATPIQEDGHVENLNEAPESLESSFGKVDLELNPSQSGQRNMKEISHLPLSRLALDERRAAAERLKTLTSERLDTMQNQLLVQNVIEEDTNEDMNSLQRPGSGYRRFRRSEDLEGVAKEFHVAVAELVGIPLQELLDAVLRAEAALDKVWLQSHRRKMKRKKDRLYDHSP
jgi:hypothetical protein